MVVTLLLMLFLFPLPLHLRYCPYFLSLVLCLPLFFVSATYSRSDAGQTGNDSRQKAMLGGWAKKYVVVEIPPYCRQRGGEEDGEVDGRKEGIKDDVFGESWSPMVPSSERDGGEAMDCSCSLEDEEERERGTDACSM